MPLARRTPADAAEIHHKLLGWLALAAALAAAAFVMIGCAGGGEGRLSPDFCLLLPAVLLPFAAAPLLLIYGLG